MLAETLNENAIKPVVLGGKVKLYYFGPDQEPVSEEGSKEIEDRFKISDMYISQNPLTEDKNNLAVWVDDLKETVFFNKTTQKWSEAK